MTPTTALVVGGTGAMGSRVARALAARTGTAVRVLTRDPSSERARALVEDIPGDVRTVRGDLDDEHSLEDAFQGVDQVFCNTGFFATADPAPPPPNSSHQCARPLRTSESKPPSRSQTQAAI
ncbi:NmrA family NAD(P)-binding protein [Streptomyces sp. NPDC059092]|uniref:NmrA family NAD(P)-binding protein n=1 Tax=Streptomyces sp. NPDC059092 TaxID=3346725 RepID=UPI0036D0C75D